MIPKIIHYCWFGGGPIPEKDLQCIQSWKKYCPDYTIIRWDESNYDIHKYKYMEQAYNEKKWGFVPDIARLDIIYQNGGIYLDTDVEIIKSFDTLLDNKAFIGFEDGCHINLGQGFGSEKNNPIIQDMIDKIYSKREFLNDYGLPDTTPSPQMQTEYLLSKGLVQDNSLQKIDNITIYPSSFFCPVDFMSGKLNVTEDTYSIHWFNASWYEPEEFKILTMYRKLNHMFGKKMGHMLAKPYDYYNKLRMHFRKRGVKGVYNVIMRKIYKSKR